MNASTSMLILVEAISRITGDSRSELHRAVTRIYRVAKDRRLPGDSTVSDA
jgi:2-oxo-4-hydroxy-4-carboxy--5-ureidoimidazoline (OHCU) decarboxylase